MAAKAGTEIDRAKKAAQKLVDAVEAARLDKDLRLNTSQLERDVLVSIGTLARALATSVEINASHYYGG